MKERVAVIGGGIVGIAQAWQEAKRGAEVTIFERNRVARGASVRNFGMVLPIGQPNGPLHSTALRSRELWTEFVDAAGLWSDPCGSLFVATRPEEFDVLSEFAQNASVLDYECDLLTPKEAVSRSAALRCDDILGALWSPTEMSVNPRQAIARAPTWLQDRYGVQLQYGVNVREVAPPEVIAANGNRWEFNRVTVASGVDLAALYPDVHRDAGLGRCKLQMLRTAAQPNGWRMGAMIAGGLTLRHYPTFRVCRSLERLKQRVADETPELDRYGIHVMAAQNEEGKITIGDSHEYGNVVSPFDSQAIYDLILQELRRFLHIPDYRIEERWHGSYAILPPEVLFTHEPAPGVKIVIATGGTGMTMSFGLAEKSIGAGPSSLQPFQSVAS